MGGVALAYLLCRYQGKCFCVAQQSIEVDACSLYNGGDACTSVTESWETEPTRTI